MALNPLRLGDIFQTSPTDYLLAGAILHFWQGRGSPSVDCPFSGKTLFFRIYSPNPLGVFMP